MSHNMLPLLIPPLEFSDLQGVLTGINAYKIDSPSTLTDFREHVINMLKLDAPAQARWEVKRDKFLNALPKLLSKLPEPLTVTFKEHKELLAKYEELLAETEVTAEEISLLKEKVRRLEECKDKNEVKEVLCDFNNEWSQFQSLCEQAKSLTQYLEPVVVEAAYHCVTEKEGRPKGEEIWDEIRDAIQDDYLIECDGNVEINYEDPRIKDYINAVNEVRSFIDTKEENSAFVKQYTEEFHHRPDFKSRRLWTKHLGLKDYPRW